ncbi:hypothetical protein RFI_40225, partial [Reticulomyxa filosa]
NIESQEESKENNMKEMILDILQTDLRIRQLRDITPEIFTEAYVFQLLYIQQDHKLSHSILQFLFEQNEQVWINITSLDDDITRTSMLAEYPHKMFKRKLVGICKDIIELIFFELSHNKNYFLYILKKKKKIKNNILQFADVRWFENVNWKLEMKEEKVDK